MADMAETHTLNARPLPVMVSPVPLTDDTLARLMALEADLAAVKATTDRLAVLLDAVEANPMVKGMMAAGG